MLFSLSVFAVGLIGLLFWLWSAYEYRAAWLYAWLFSLTLPIWLMATAAKDMQWPPTSLWSFVGTACASPVAALSVLLGLFLLMCGFSKGMASHLAMLRFLRISPAIMCSCALAFALHALQAPALGLAPAATLPHVAGGAYGMIVLWLWWRKFKLSSE